MAVCQRCGHDWKVRVKGRPPRRCPNCTSAAWDRELKRAGRKPGKQVFRATRQVISRGVEKSVQTVEVSLELPQDPLDQAREIVRRIYA